MLKRKGLLPATVVAGGLFALTFAPSAIGREYDVTIKNLTEGQPLTPPVVATHRGSHQVFEVGQPASVGVREIAENGNNAPLLAFLDADPFDRISRFRQAGDEPLVPDGTPGASTFGDKVSFDINGKRTARRLSYAAMLICTNDGFTGVDSLRLPEDVGDRETKRSDGYDAMTEVNSEDYADIVPPCQDLIGDSSGETGSAVSDPALAEGGVIEHHENIQGGNDLEPGLHGWDDLVARIRVERSG
jgi:hypothetical protein